MPNRREIKTVLIIEDDVDIRNFASWTLEVEGYRVLQAGDGDEGLRLLKDNPIALVLLDLKLPEKDGWTVLEKMKDTPELSAIPVIVFTASARANERDRALSMGASDYIGKPVSANTMVKSVTNILHPKR